MSIQLVTYANQTVTPTNDAIIYEKAVDQNGIFYGCNVTVTSNNVNITGGYGIVCGREFVINSESIAVTLAPSGTLDGRLYVRLDLADADAPIQLLTATGNTLPPLVQDDDVNYTSGVYEMELATFTVGVSSLSDVVETFETIYGSKHSIVNFIQVAMTNTQNIGTTSTLCNYDKLIRYNGSSLTLDTSAKAVVVGKGVDFVEVSGSIWVTSFGTAGLKNGYIYLNNDEIATTIVNATANYLTINVGPRIIAVSEGDEITIRAKSTAGTMAISTDGIGSTDSLVVKVVG